MMCMLRACCLCVESEKSIFSMSSYLHRDLRTRISTSLHVLFDLLLAVFLLLIFFVELVMRTAFFAFLRLVPFLLCPLLFITTIFAVVPVFIFLSVILSSSFIFLLCIAPSDSTIIFIVVRFFIIILVLVIFIPAPASAPRLHAFSPSNHRKRCTDDPSQPHLHTATSASI